jgi:hypothetical protein
MFTPWLGSDNKELKDPGSTSNDERGIGTSVVPYDLEGSDGDTGDSDRANLNCL